MNDGDLDALLEHVRHNRGFDFNGYKRSSLERRVGKRIEQTGVGDVAEYLDYLEVHPDEFAQLFNTILINVTSFFRDAPAWRYLREHTIPELLERKPKHEPIRVWSAGTASGEEAYSLALVLADLLGLEGFAERVKVYATDVDEDALIDARHGVYELKAAEAIPDDLAERFLQRTDGRVTFAKELRRAVIFGRNDLIQDAPISRIDLLACRNTLMYFTAEAQSRILGRFHFALADEGILFLGRSEMLVTHSALFRPVDMKCRVFAKVPRAQGRRPAFPQPESNGMGEPDATPESLDLREVAWDAGGLAQIVIDGEGRLTQVNREARDLFGLARADLGRDFHDLELSYRPVELRSAIEKAAGQGSPVTFPDVRWSAGNGDERRLEIAVQPLKAGSTTLGTTVTFRDGTAELRLSEDLERSRRELEVAYEELQSTVEELETTNEELQSTNEELETTNEELQSTNEELETMNEELQSTNEELETTNDELRVRTSELHDINDLLETVMGGLSLAVVAVDREGVIQLWNDRSMDLWGLREDEAVGTHLLALDIGLPVDHLRAPLRRTLGGEEQSGELEVDAVNRRGRAVRVRVAYRPLHGPAEGVAGALLLLEELDGTRDGDRAVVAEG